MWYIIIWYMFEKWSIETLEFNFNLWSDWNYFCLYIWMPSVIIGLYSWWTCSITWPPIITTDRHTLDFSFLFIHPSIQGKSRLCILFWLYYPRQINYYVRIFIIHSLWKSKTKFIQFVIELLIFLCMYIFIY